MSEVKPVIKTVKASEARQRWAELLNQVFRRESRIVVEKSGIPVAAIVSAADLEILKQVDEERQRDLAAIERARRAFRDVPDAELEQEIARAIGEVRAEARSAREGNGSSA